MDGGQHDVWGETGQSRVRRLSRVCALTARSADGTELFHGLPRLCGFDRRLLEAVGLNLDAPLAVVNSKSVVDTRKNSGSPSVTVNNGLTDANRFALSRNIGLAAKINV